MLNYSVAHNVLNIKLRTTTLYFYGTEFEGNVTAVKDNRVPLIITPSNYNFQAKDTLLTSVFAVSSSIFVPLWKNGLKHIYSVRESLQRT